MEEIPEPMEQIPKPVEENPAIVNEASKPVDAVPQPLYKIHVPVDESPILMEEILKPIENIPKPMEKAPEPVEESPELIEDTAKPIGETPECVVEIPEAIEGVSIPIEETPKPIQKNPQHIEEIPKPMEEDPKPIDELSEPIEKASKPIKETSESVVEPNTMNKLHIENGIIYTFKDEINAFEVEEYLIDHIYQYKIGTRFIVFCGFHTSDDGQLAGTDLNLVDQYQAMFDRLNNEFCTIIFERQYQMGKIVPLRSKKSNCVNYILTSQSKSAIKMLAEDIVMTKTPYILILASCHSHRSEVSTVLRSAGIYSALHISEDLGKLTKGKSFFLSQEQMDLIQLVSTQLNKKDIIIFGKNVSPKMSWLQCTKFNKTFVKNILGFYGSGKTMMAAEVVKIKVAQQIAQKEDVEAHTFTFHERLNQLKSDIGKIWFFGYDETNVTDLKKYVERFSKSYQLTPEQQSRLEEYDHSSDDFKMTLQSLARQLNQSGKTHIILIDEVDLRNVTLQGESIKGDNLELDLSYTSEYENVHFIFCLRPAKLGVNNFSISFPNLQLNQHFAYLGTCYRNAEAIQRLIKYLLSHIDAKSEGYSLMGDIPMTTMLPPPLIPSGYQSSVIWVPTIPSVEDEAIEKISILLLFDEIQGERKPSIAILHTNKRSKVLAKSLIHKNPNWSGPHEDINYNGSEADIIVYSCDRSMNIQSIARAKRLLIILTCETECNHETNWILQQAVSQNLAEILRTGYCPDKMTKCNECGSTYNHVQNDQCPDHVICPNFSDGCEWIGLPGLQKTHLEDCEYCCHVQNDQCPEPVIHPIFSLQYYFGIGMFFFVILIVLLIAILFRFKEDGFSYLYYECGVKCSIWLRVYQNSSKNT